MCTDVANCMHKPTCCHCPMFVTSKLPPFLPCWVVLCKNVLHNWYKECAGASDTRNSSCLLNIVTDVYIWFNHYELMKFFGCIVVLVWYVYNISILRLTCVSDIKLNHLAWAKQDWHRHMFLRAHSHLAQLLRPVPKHNCSPPQFPAALHPRNRAWSSLPLVCMSSPHRTVEAQ